MTNEVLNTMKTRRSCRCYLDKMPEPEALNAVLEAVRQMVLAKREDSANDLYPPPAWAARAR